MKIFACIVIYKWRNGKNLINGIYGAAFLGAAPCYFADNMRLNF